MEMTAKQYARRWADALKQAPRKEWDAVSDRLLRSMAAQIDAAMMGQIKEELEQLLAPDTIPVHITSARELKPAEESKLLKTLLGSQKVLVTTAVDSTLIGGVVVRTADEQWDLSVKHQLERLKRSIVES